MHRKAFTVVELLVSIAIIGLLVAILLPAVLSARASARRAQCQSNLRQFGVAIQSFEATHVHFPPGGDEQLSFHVRLLPHLEQQPLRTRIDAAIAAAPGASATFLTACQVAPEHFSAFLCPDDSGSPDQPPSLPCGGSNYAGNFGSGVQRFGFNGLFRFLSPTAWGGPPNIRPQDASDGLSQTAAVGEILLGSGSPERLRSLWLTPYSLTLPDELDQFAVLCEAVDPSSAASIGPTGLPWTNGSGGRSLYCHILPPNRPSCTNGGSIPYGAFTAASLHSGGVNLLLADGAVRFISEQIDRDVWRAAGSRNGRELLSPDL